MKILNALQNFKARKTLNKEFNLPQIVGSVIKLHKPSRDGSNAYCLGCTAIARDWVDYPCPTIMAIREVM